MTTGDAQAGKVHESGSQSAARGRGGVIDKVDSLLRQLAYTETSANDRPIRKWSRSYLYGRSRANRWPLWISWLLAPSKQNRRIVRDLRAIRKAGGDV